MERTGARAAIAVWLAGVAALAVVAALPGSPLQPPLIGDSAAWSVSAPSSWRVAGDDPAAVIGSGFAVALSIVGFLLIIRAADRGRLSLRAAIMLTAIGCAVVLLLPLLYSRDVYSYILYGRIWAVHGANPYLVTPNQVSADPFFPLVGSQWRATTSVYGPAFTALSAGIAEAAPSPKAAVAAFRLLSVAAVFVATLLISWTAGRVQPDRAALAVAAFGLNPAVLFQTAASGHNDALVALAIAAALALAASRRELAVTVVLTLGTLVKSTCGVALVLWLVIVLARRTGPDRWRTLGIHLASVSVLAVVTALPFLSRADPSLGQTQLIDHEGWLAPARVVRVLAERLGEAVSPATGEAAGTTARVVFAALLVAGLVAVAVTAWRRSASSRAAEHGPAELAANVIETGAAWGWGFLVVMIAGPVLIPWYVAWGLPAVWTLPRVPRRTVLTIAMLLMASLIVVDSATFPDAFQLTARWANYVLAPIVLVLAVEPARELIRRARTATGLSVASSDPPPGR